MHKDHQVFIDAITSKTVISVRYRSMSDAQMEIRTCAPMDYGPLRRSSDQSDRYHVWDYDGTNGPHVSSLTPDQIDRIAALDQSFDPVEFVKWAPNWIVPRDWGRWS